MTAAVRAGSAYFAVVFAAGFVLGVLRTLVFAPAIGRLAAVALELPLILAVAVMASGVIVRRVGVEAAVAPRLVMGGVAFGLLMLAEYALSALMFGRSPATHLALYARPEQLLGLAGQVAFALLPALSLLGRRTR
jgi:hypothetical protein